jgi:hypothetical protein
LNYRYREALLITCLIVKECSKISLILKIRTFATLV